MGRPINKRRFGKLPDADDATFYPLTGDTFFNMYKLVVRLKVLSVTS